MNVLLSCFSAFARQKREDWSLIEERAKSIEKLPSWGSTNDNICMLEAFEWYVPHDGRHWRRLRQALPDLKDIGIDNLLLPPGCKAMNPSGNGYDIYDLYDLGEFHQKGAIATKWGSKDDLKGLASLTEELDMGIYWDAVLNHKAGADRKEKCLAVTVDSNDRNIDLTKPQEIEAWVGFDFSNRGELYSRMKYHWQHFNGIDYNDLDKKKGIYKIFAPGKDWARDVSTENGNYDYLMFANIDYSNEEVREDVLKWADWISGQLPLRGMRLDAVKHYSSDFQCVLVDHIRQTVGRDWFIVSEFWSGKVDELQDHLRQVNHRVHLFDAPLCQRLSAISQTRDADLRLVFESTLVKNEPEHAVTFVMNHDTQPSQALEAPVSNYFKPIAYALILLRKDGYPCVFFGDLYGICSKSGRLTKPHFSQEKAIASGAKDSGLQTVPALILARKLYAYGEQQDYFSSRNCIGFVRYGNARHPWGMACVMNNGILATKLRMFVGKKHAGERWTDLLQGHHSFAKSIQEKAGVKIKDKKKIIQISSNGYATFPVASMSVSVWVNEDAEGRRRFEDRFNDDFYSY